MGYSSVMSVLSSQDYVYIVMSYVLQATSYALFRLISDVTGRIICLTRLYKESLVDKQWGFVHHKRN